MNRIIVALLFITATLTFCSGEDSMLTIGSTAPEFTLAASNGDTISLSAFRNVKNVVLIFYPGDQTPVCTKQLCEIRDGFSQFEAKNTSVFGVNPATEKSHKSFVEKHGFQFPLLIDTDNTVAKLYGAKGTIMNKHTVYVINREGKVVFAERGKPSVGEILKAVGP